MPNEQERPAKPKGRGKLVAGIISFIIGVNAIGLFLFLSYDAAMADHYEAMTALGIAALGCCILAIVGMVLFFIGVIEGRKRMEESKHPPV